MKIGLLQRFDPGQNGHERQQCFVAAGLAPLDAALLQKNEQALAVDDAFSDQESAKRDGRIDVTDPEMTRFILTGPEAIGRLVALESRPFVGEVVAPRMRSYRLGDLATAFARQSGATVRVIGPRPGEKLHEDLVSKDEAPTARNEGDLIVIDGRAGPGIDPFTSADADHFSERELSELVRSS